MLHITKESSLAGRKKKNRNEKKKERHHLTAKKKKRKIQLTNKSKSVHKQIKLAFAWRASSAMQPCTTIAPNILHGMHLGLKTQQIFFPLYRVVRAERRGGGDARVGWGGVEEAGRAWPAAPGARAAVAAMRAERVSAAASWARGAPGRALRYAWVGMERWYSFSTGPGFDYGVSVSGPAHLNQTDVTISIRNRKKST